jgi:hypothetical protein
MMNKQKQITVPRRYLLFRGGSDKLDSDEMESSSESSDVLSDLEQRDADLDEREGIFSFPFSFAHPSNTNDGMLCQVAKKSYQ